MATQTAAQLVFTAKPIENIFTGANAGVLTVTVEDSGNNVVFPNTDLALEGVTYKV